MLTVTLIAQPGALDGALVAPLRNAWGGGDIVWLSDSEAAEFPILSMPDNRDDVWHSLQGESVDLCIQQTGHRRKKMLIADMDSTMIEQECIDELAAEAGVGARVAEITARAMNGELDFEGALIERVGLLAGLDTSVIDKVLTERITLAAGGTQLLTTMKASGAQTVLVSGGFTAFAAQVGAQLGFDEVQANVLEARGGVLTGAVQMPILGRDAKIEALDRFAAAAGLDPSQVVAVGDGANDLGMLGRAGMGVAVHAKPAVQAECDLRINHGDLTALLYLQGYHKAEFSHPDPAEDFAV